MQADIAVIGAGAMGSAVGGRLTRNGAHVRSLLEGRSAASRARAAAAGMKDSSPSEIASAEVILSIVPPAEAMEVADRLAPFLAGASGSPLFIDCNALGPTTKTAMAERLNAAGVDMVDGAIIGGPPTASGEGPTFYVSGPRAAEVARLEELGLHVHILGEAIGAAAALKMSYAGINKGLTALTTAMLLAAERSGAGRDLCNELAKSLPYVAARSRKSVPDMYPKAYRWVAEMREIAAFLRDSDEAAAKMFEGAASFFEQRAADHAEERRELALLKAILDQPQ